METKQNFDKDKQQTLAKEDDQSFQDDEDLPPKYHGEFMVAIYDYEARVDDDVPFQRGDILEVIEKEDGSDWWYAENRKNDIKGYIPRLYVAQLHSIEAEPWFFGEMKREEATRSLMRPENDSEAFLIRNHDPDERSNIRLGWFHLSWRQYGRSLGDYVDHYEIQTTDSGKYKENNDQDFPRYDSLFQLVEYFPYSPGAYGLILPKFLKIPALKDKSPILRDLSHETEKQWEIERSSLTIRERLGAGQFSEVYRGYWKGKVPVTIKSLKPGLMNKERFLEEATIMKRMNHRKLITLFAVVTASEPILIVTEPMTKGNLLEFLRGKDKKLPFEKLLYLGVEVLQAMLYMEKNNFVHGHLAARNVLIGEYDLLKVSDFGLSKCYNDDVSRESSVKWIAPEAYHSNQFTIKSDVWSFGILMYEIMTHGGVPYPGMKDSEVIAAVDRGYRMERPRLLSPRRNEPQIDKCKLRYYDYMTAWWKKIPEERPSFESLSWMFDDYFGVVI